MDRRWSLSYTKIEGIGEGFVRGKAHRKTAAIPTLIIKIKGYLLSYATIQKSMTNKKYKHYQHRLAKQGLKFTMQNTARKIFATRFLSLFKKGITHNQFSYRHLTKAL